MTSFPIGRLNGVQAEPGTILGPESMGQWIVVVEQDERGVVCSYAGVQDLDDARQRLANGVAPQSIAERSLMQFDASVPTEALFARTRTGQ